MLITYVVLDGRYFGAGMLHWLSLQVAMEEWDNPLWLHVAKKGGAVISDCVKFSFSKLKSHSWVR